MKTFTDFLGKAASNIASTKLFITLVTMAAIAGLAYFIGGKDVAVQALYAIAGVGATYTGAKTYQNIKLSASEKTSADPQQILPIVTPVPQPQIIQKQVELSPQDTQAPPVDQPEVQQPDIPFDKELFMQKVESGVISHYGVRNNCTLLYEAEAVYSKWQFQCPREWKEGRAFMYQLAERAFKEIWGQTYEEAIINLNDNPPCTYPNLEYKAMQKGMPYYAILLELKRFQD